MLHTNSSNLPKRLFQFSIIAFFALMFCFPDASLAGAKRGLLLWFNTVLPTLLPFIIISTLLVHLNIASFLCKLCYPVIGKLFGVSKSACDPILLGFLTGIPLGAKTCSDLVSAGTLSVSEGQFLASMCNNASPMFVLSYIALSELNLPHLSIFLIVILYGSSIISAYILRHFYSFYTGNTYHVEISSLQEKVYVQSLNSTPVQRKKSYILNFTVVDEAILDGFEVITKIGGYIILFSIFAQIILSIPGLHDWIKFISVGICEITIGIDTIAKSALSAPMKIVLILTITSFGGFSGLAQTKSVFAESGLSIKTYLKVKLTNTIITLLLASLYVKFIL